METTIRQFTQTPRTRSEVIAYVETIRADILEGNIPPLAVATILKAMEDSIKLLRGDEAIREVIQDEADLYNEKTFEVNGTKFTKSERPTYNFANCEDSQWDGLKADFDNIKAAMKSREGWLKTVKGFTADPVTGEVVKPPFKKSTTVLSITLKK